MEPGMATYTRRKIDSKEQEEDTSGMFVIKYKLQPCKDCLKMYDYEHQIRGQNQTKSREKKKLMEIRFS